jgi:hypothetical protein
MSFSICRWDVDSCERMRAASRKAGRTAQTSQPYDPVGANTLCTCPEANLQLEDIQFLHIVAGRVQKPSTSGTQRCTTDPLLRVKHNAQIHEGRNTLDNLAPTHAVLGEARGARSPPPKVVTLLSSGLMSLPVISHHVEVASNRRWRPAAVADKNTKSSRYPS